MTRPDPGILTSSHGSLARGVSAHRNWRIDDADHGNRVRADAGRAGTSPAHRRVAVRLGDRGRVLHKCRAEVTEALENDRRLREMVSMRAAAEADAHSLLTRLGRKEITDSVVGAESGLLGVLERVELVAWSDVPVFVLGETGTGKELIARLIHTQSSRSSGPFLRINCGAIPLELIDSQLFGHERGAFTGAVESRQGWFERADGGTLLLDEIGELPLAAQVRLLRILQDGWLERVGATTRFTWTCVSWPRRIEIWPPWSAKASSAKTCGIDWRSFRSSCLHCVTGWAISRNSPGISPNELRSDLRFLHRCPRRTTSNC